MNTTPLTDHQLDEIAGRAAGLYEYATGLDTAWQDEADQLAGTDVPALLADLRRLRTQLGTMRSETMREAADLVLKTTAPLDWDADAVSCWNTALNIAEHNLRQHVATVLAPRRTLTPDEYSAAWHAVEGAAGEEGADPGTVLHAVLDRLGIDLPPAPPVHACPPDGSGVTPCCGRTPFELPRTDRMTTDPAEATTAPVV